MGKPMGKLLGKPMGKLLGKPMEKSEALNRPHMKHWVDHIRSTEYIAYEALNISHMKHLVDHI